MDAERPPEVSRALSSCGCPKLVQSTVLWTRGRGRGAEGGEETRSCRCSLGVEATASPPCPPSTEPSGSHGGTGAERMRGSNRSPFPEKLFRVESFGWWGNSTEPRCLQLAAAHAWPPAARRRACPSPSLLSKTSRCRQTLALRSRRLAKQPALQNTARSRYTFFN